MLQNFQHYYWLKEDLQTFCHANGISASGSKIEISKRISIFLETGVIQKPIRTTTSKSKIIAADLTLDTVITQHHRCSQTVRAFLKLIIPNFHFSTYIQNYFKDNVGKTYRDVANAWHKEEQRKKDPSYKKDIAPQFEYNQFIRDYFADPKNCEKSREDAIKTWNKIKILPSSNKYLSN
ncbi:cytoplasmic protein [Niallia nealsonii]|uniref:Cytoplasmic protein n=1 Tax=Niallia nealsonii TaxID=115979 RepID=A0A2N0Z020_9BACI|nr:cytoplasmic protein [Niallia nealsonii]